MGSGWRYGEGEDFTIRTMWKIRKKEKRAVSSPWEPLEKSAAEPLVVNAELATRRNHRIIQRYSEYPAGVLRHGWKCFRK
jgi:hypothetical protein